MVPCGLGGKLSAELHWRPPADGVEENKRQRGRDGGIQLSHSSFLVLESAISPENWCQRKPSSPRFKNEFREADFRGFLAEHFIKNFVRGPQTFRFVGVGAACRLQNPKWFPFVSDLDAFAAARNAFHFAGLSNQRAKRNGCHTVRQYWLTLHLSTPSPAF